MDKGWICILIELDDYFLIIVIILNLMFVVKFEIILKIVYLCNLNCGLIIVKCL